MESNLYFNPNPFVRAESAKFPIGGAILQAQVTCTNHKAAKSQVVQFLYSRVSISRKYCVVAKQSAILSSPKNRG